ncbi:hypothetical protein CEP53_013796 [Fusarium sp. AF-6]|nr:hypothetical protein CEP53_013796 [Fusarium sp. AF-6]
MSPHKGYNKLPRQAILEDRLLYLPTQSGQARNRDRDHEYPEATWVPTVPSTWTTQHMGYYIVECPVALTQDRAIVQFQGVKFKSKRIVTRLLQRNYICGPCGGQGRHRTHPLRKDFLACLNQRQYPAQHMDYSHKD